MSHTAPEQQEESLRGVDGQPPAVVGQDGGRSDARAIGDGSSADKLDRGIIVISLVVVLGAIMSVLDTTIVNVALATLGRDLHASLSTARVEAAPAEG
jgi:hypothetical protein